MPSLPWYKFYPSKWLSSETRLAMTLAERSVYRDLLDCNYEKGSLPKDPSMLAQLAGASQEEFDQAWPKVAKNFRPCADHPARITNPIAEEELQRRAEKVAAGKSGGRPRTKKPGGLQTKSETKTQSQTESQTLEAQTSAHPQLQMDERSNSAFQEFLTMYPKKTSGEKARRAYASKVTTEELHLQVMDGLCRWMQSQQWQRSLSDDGGRFLPDPDRFLTDQLWKDHPPVIGGGGSNLAVSAFESARRRRKE